jgi:hypothetical protein
MEGLGSVENFGPEFAHFWHWLLKLTDLKNRLPGVILHGLLKK